MAASSKRLKDAFPKHGWAEFRQNVFARYGAAAQLVPKLLTGDELAFLFGVKKLVLKDPRNGITLHKNVEVALDSGKIAIVPLATVHEHQWKCALVEQKTRDEAVCSYESKVLQRKDLDNQDLKSLTPNRTARRYLYFRFLVTDLHATMMGNKEFTSTVDGRQQFWVSPGEYLDCSTLKSLARNLRDCGHFARRFCDGR